MPTAVVTGCNSGIGYAFANILCDRGYKVYALDKTIGEAMESLSHKAQIFQLDVTDPASFLPWAMGLEGQQIDLLLNVAGIMFPPEADSLRTTNLSVLSKTFAVNTFGPLLLTQILLPNLLAAPRAKVGLVSSRVGSIGDNSSGGSYAYRSSKAALNSIGKSMAVELKSSGVLVMLLHPGHVRSSLTAGMKMPPDTVEPDSREIVEECGEQ